MSRDLATLTTDGPHSPVRAPGAGPGLPAPEPGSGGTFRWYLAAEAHPGAVAAFRHAARRKLAGWHLDHIAGDAELVLSELAANAVAATRAAAPAGQKIAAYLALDLGRLFIMVWDCCRAEPSAHAGHAGADAESGRGLTIVGALTEKWGCAYPPEGGKAVWAILAIPA